MKGTRLKDSADSTSTRQIFRSNFRWSKTSVNGRTRKRLRSKSESKLRKKPSGAAFSSRLNEIGKFCFKSNRPCGSSSKLRWRLRD